MLAPYFVTFTVLSPCPRPKFITSFYPWNFSTRMFYAFLILPVPSMCKVKSNPITGLDRPRGFQEAEAPRFQDNRHVKMVRSALRTGRLYPPGNTPCTHFCSRLSQFQGHSATGRIMPIKNSTDTIGNRTRDLPICSAVPQPTSQPRASCKR